MPALEIEMEETGSSTRLTPPAKAKEQSPSRRARMAWCTATSEAEQAVSTAHEGPVRPRVKLTRPEAVLVALPVA